MAPAGFEPATAFAADLTAAVAGVLGLPLPTTASISCTHPRGQDCVAQTMLLGEPIAREMKISPGCCTHASAGFYGKGSCAHMHYAVGRGGRGGDCTHIHTAAPYL